MNERIKYYQKVDKKLKLIDLTFDKMFKSVFASNKNVLKKFLLTELNLDMKPEETTIDISNNELLKELNTEYQKTVDIIVYLNNEIITNIESNKSAFNDIKDRNYFYFAKLHTLVLKEGDNPKKPTIKELYQLNINSNENDNKFGEDEYQIKSTITNKPLIENFKILAKNVAYYRNLYYNKHEMLTNAGMWLVALSSKSFAELYKIIRKLLPEDEAGQFMESVIIMSGKEEILTEFERQRLDAIKEIKTIENAKNKGKQEGLEIGKKETARRMLAKNIDIKTISEITDLTEEQIKDLK